MSVSASGITVDLAASGIADLTASGITVDVTTSGIAVDATSGTAADSVVTGLLDAEVVPLYNNNEEDF